MLDCPVCGSGMERESCWCCFGEGGWHDCGEDCCPCAEPDLNETCPECNGEGEYWICWNLKNHPNANRKE